MTIRKKADVSEKSIASIFRVKYYAKKTTDKKSRLFLTGYLFGLLFDVEDRGDRFLRKVGLFRPT
jgi:hypothetical protein